MVPSSNIQLKTVLYAFLFMQIKNKKCREGDSSSALAEGKEK